MIQASDPDGYKEPCFSGTPLNGGACVRIMSVSSADRLRFEVCVDSLESALQAQDGGADRLEVCSSLLYGGGMTPSYGLVKAIRQVCQIPLMIMIRPRVGDFIYSDTELEVMEEDIRSFTLLGVEGFVFGVLTPDGEVDRARTQRLVDAAGSCKVTFHRAFDVTADFVGSYRAVASIPGVNRILTSGLTPKLMDGGLETLAHCIPQVPERASSETRTAPQILPGSGINTETIKNIIQALWPLGVTEYHLSGGQVIQRQGSSEPGFIVGRSLREMGMGSSGLWMTQASVLREVRQAAMETVEDLGDKSSV